MLRDPARKCFCGCGLKIEAAHRDLNRTGNEFRGQTYEMATLTVHAADPFTLAFQRHPKWADFYMAGHRLEEEVRVALHEGTEISPEFYEQLVAWYWDARPRNVALKRVLKESRNGQALTEDEMFEVLDQLWLELDAWIAEDQRLHPSPPIIPT